MLYSWHKKSSALRMLLQWAKSNSVMLVNAGSLIGTTAVTSVLGFVFWWLAARHFPPEAIGIASASVSAMMLLGNFCILGLGTLLITELPRQPGQEASLMSTALIVVGGVGGVVGILFAVVAPYTSPGFGPLRANIVDIILFASGVSLMAITLVLDQAFIGILRGGLQFWRNALFAVAKLLLVFGFSFWLSGEAGMTLYATFPIGNVLSLAVLALYGVSRKRSGGSRRNYLPQWSLLRKLGFAAVQHHLLNLTLQFPTLALPLLVTVMLSAKINAWFYVSWMIVSFVFVVPGALTTVLHAMNSAQPSTLAQKAKVTIGLALVTSLVANGLLQLATKQVLSLFGSSYAEQAAWCMRILVLAAFPLIIKNHYISICRIQDRIAGAMLAMLPGGLLELGAAALGAHLGGLSGLSIGWVAAIGVEAMFMFRTVYKAVWSVETAGQDYIGMEAVWLLETASMPVVGQSYMDTEAIWLMETASMPALKQPSIATHEESVQQDKASQCNSSSQFQLKPPELQRYKSRS